MYIMKSFMNFCLIFIFFPSINGDFPDDEKAKFCEELVCGDDEGDEVCGMRRKAEEVEFKIFDNWCELLQHGCQFKSDQTYGIIKMKYCVQATTNPDADIANHVKFVSSCPYNCSGQDYRPVCGIRQHGDGYKVRTFNNKCELQKYNCLNRQNGLGFNATEFFICNSDESYNQTFNTENETVTEQEPTAFSTQVAKLQGNKPKQKAVVVVDGSMLDRRNINESIKKFFASTHVLGLPIRDMQPFLNDSARRMMMKLFGPAVVFKPWKVKPNNLNPDDEDQIPTLNSCYHKCPKQCPDFYAPVCGSPGIEVQHPSLMFKNHCFMDEAQCRLYKENKYVTSKAIAYIESSFVFCMAEPTAGVFKFLPILRTLQRMGRIKKKGKYYHKLRNMRYFNNLHTNIRG